MTTTTPTPKTAEDLAQEALDAGASEVAASDKLADTLTSLQNVIERNAQELEGLQQELKERRESLRSVFENDAQLAEVSAQAEMVKEQVSERRSVLKNSPQSIALQQTIKDLNQQKKEIEETLSNHLINYYSLTNSTSFDTSDGDQWEFKIKAKVKSRS